ncbi:hypothetical protein [Methylobacterium sp. WL120]|uniref:hypothetical protein n=1 Tax=Methylobacterium sp. WL120 TaxID=2603887 RepID=UPI0011C73318|nr:hypothetical protein [Methylobacterium sp. WL120]TXM64520.1 hypothetical protein FV229_18425 [Methylobacterium sp. WL120]
MTGNIKLTPPSARWSIVQALSWVLSRDEAFVKAIGSAQDPPTSYTHLSVMMRAAGFKVDKLGQFERELIAGIANGDVKADGEPGRDYESRRDRRGIGSVARGSHIDFISQCEGDGFFLEPQTEQQSRWYEVEIDSSTLCIFFPTLVAARTRNRGGRPKKFDWDAIKAHVMKELAYHDMPSIDDREWMTKADVVRSALTYCQKAFRSEPGESTMKGYVALWLREFQTRAGN